MDSSRFFVDEAGVGCEVPPLGAGRAARGPVGTLPAEFCQAAMRSRNWAFSARMGAAQMERSRAPKIVSRQFVFMGGVKRLADGSECLAAQRSALFFCQRAAQHRPSGVP